MENSIDRLAKLAESASAHDREQIKRIIRSTNDAADTAQKTAEIMKRMMAGQADNAHEKARSTGHERGS